MKWMQVRILGIAFLLLSACTELSNEKAQLLDAVAFVIFNIEEGAPLNESSGPIVRKVLSTGIEYTFPSKANRNTDSSKAVLTSPSQCVFSMDFGPSNVYSIDLNKAHRLEIESSLRGEMYIYGKVSLEGSNVYCDNNLCENEYNFTFMGYNGELPLTERMSIIGRRERAVMFIKRTCAGKPY